MTVDGGRTRSPAVHGGRDAEPDRVRGHVPAARGAARPVPDAALARLPAARRRGAHARRADERAAARTLEPVATRADVLGAAIEEAARVYVEESLYRYVVAVLRETRGNSRLYLGASPRAGIALLRVAKARALAEGRDYVAPGRRQDRRRAGARAPADPRARGALRRARPREELVREVLERTPVPVLSAMTRRGWLALALGVAALRRRLALGSKPLYPVAVGLVLAVVAASAWVRLSARPMRLRRGPGKGAHVEGERRPGQRSTSSAESRLPPAALVVDERIGRLGEQATTLSGAGGGSAARTCSSACRAAATSSSRRARCSTTRSGSRAMDVELDARGSLLVYPRLVALDRLFSESGAARAGRPAAAAAAPVGLRPPLGARVRAGRVAAEGALADDGAPRAADGEGARGRAARRDRGRARRGRERGRRGQLRRPGARRRLDPARARVARPAGGAGRQLGGSADRPGHLARRRLAGGARRPRRGGAGRDAAGGRAALARGRAAPRGRSRLVVVTARALRRARDELVQRLARGQGVSVVWVDAASFAARPTRSSRSCCGSRRRASPSRSSGAATRWPQCSARRPCPERTWVERPPSTPSRRSLIALGWLRLEDTRAAASTALVARARARAGAGADALAAAGARGSGRARLPPGSRSTRPRSTTGPASSARSLDRFRDGVGGFYDVAVPFSARRAPADARRRPPRDLRLLRPARALIAARRPLLAVARGDRRRRLAGNARTRRGASLYGAVILAAALWVLAGIAHDAGRPGARSPARRSSLVAAAASTLGGRREGRRPRVGELGPERQLGDSRSSVSYVWDAQLRRDRVPEEGDDRPPDHGPEARPLLARDDARPVRLGPLAREPDAALDRPRDRLAERPASARPLAEPEHLGPSRTSRSSRSATTTSSPPRSRWRSTHRSLGGVFHLSDGVVARLRRPRRGQTLHRLELRAAARRRRSWRGSRPSTRPRSSATSSIGRTRVDPFGAPGRDCARRRPLRRRALPRALAVKALGTGAAAAGGARTPYAAVVALETWLRSTGGFTYDESPPADRRACRRSSHFVAAGKRGYCQHFAGAMALMLRMLGDSRARRGRLHERQVRRTASWTVTDHDAHAWVEVWFPGYGWLPFDPTPGRGSLAANYSASRPDSTPATPRTRFVRRRGRASTGAERAQRLLAEGAAGGAPRRGGARRGRGPARRSGCSSCSRVAAAGAIGAAKLMRRRLAISTRDPRRLRRCSPAGARGLPRSTRGSRSAPSATPEELQQLVQNELGADGRRFAAGAGRSAVRAARRERCRRSAARAGSCERCCG